MILRDSMNPDFDFESRLSDAEADARNALRELALVLTRARLSDEDDRKTVVDLLLRAGYIESTDADTAILDAIGGEA